MENGHWDYPYQMGNPEWFGFLYFIYDTQSHKGYLGRKQYRVDKPRTRKNGKWVDNPNHGKYAGWRPYKSSCKPLKEAIKKRPNDFKFYALAEFEDGTDLHYWEASLIFEYGCLLHPWFYNNHCPEIYVLPKQRDSRWRDDFHTIISQAGGLDG